MLAVFPCHSMSALLLCKTMGYCFLLRFSRYESDTFMSEVELMVRLALQCWEFNPTRRYRCVHLPIRHWQPFLLRYRCPCAFRREHKAKRIMLWTQHDPVNTSRDSCYPSKGITSYVLNPHVISDHAASFRDGHYCGSLLLEWSSLSWRKAIRPI